MAYFYWLIFDHFHHSKTPLGVSDNTWHHVCVLWEVSNELLEVFKDGERKYLSTGFQSSTQHVGIEGTVAEST